MSRLMLNSILVALLVLSALAVVYAKHQNRKLYAELTALYKERDAMNVEWGRLQLEQSTWATHGRIEKIARQRLRMRNVDYNKVVIVKQ
ncbi:MAG: cell division protein FtsL [Gammaproteobacteria bacterium]|nr:cell division protein FtsL [Gammaproteobacteria bacterium]MDH5777696.1 cell division protein FtsL [Gammaproteobacteria bacterium]